MSRIAALPSEVPVVVTGDFNTTPGSPAHAAATTALQDAWTSAARRSGPEGTFHGFTGQPEQRIDWVLVRGFEVRSASTLDGNEAGRFPSDHFPLLVELR